MKSGDFIQAEIDKAASLGGGRIVVPAGEYNVGSIQLKSGIELHLEKGAVLLGGTRSEDYFSFPREICSIQPEKSSRVFIYAYNAEDIAITGEGVVDGCGPSFFDTSEKVRKWGCYPKPPVERPRMIQFVRCRNIRLEGVTFKDSPCWTMLIRLCENVDISGILITADQKMINNDGIDIDGCRHVRVRDSRFKTCDDCLILRAMREHPDEHIICEDVVVSNCDLDSCCQTIRLGCPSDDTIRNALFKDIRAKGQNGIFADYPERYLRPDDTGFMDIGDITVDNYSGTFTGSALQIVSEPGVRVRNVDGLVFRNFTVKSARPLRFIGNSGCEIKAARLENFVADVGEAGTPYIAVGCLGLDFRNVTINGARCPDGPVRSQPGSSEPLKRGKSVSWESAS